VAEKAQSAEHESEQRKRQQAPEPPAFAEVVDSYGETGFYMGGIRIDSGDPVDQGSALIGDRRLPASQRQAIARSIGRAHGNRHLGRVIARLGSASAGIVQRNGDGPAPAPAAPGTAAGGGPVGVIAAAEALKARAQEILKNTYGFIKPIIPTPVQVVDEATLRVKFDEMQVRKGTNNTRTGEPWKMGDSLLVFQRLDGFADRDNNVIYVPDGAGGSAEGQLPTVVHEMLHTNAAGDWASTVGFAIDEGETENLALKACTAQRVPMTPTYASQRGLVGQLVPVVGEDTLQRAYFSGGAMVVAAFDAVRGEGKWNDFKKAMGEGDREKVDKILKAPHQSDWAKEKIQIILGLIHSWWVTDEDVGRIVAICGTASPEDLRAISAAVSPEVSSLMNEGQRARIRFALGA
jgi:hypothetical protein